MKLSLSKKALLSILIILLPVIASFFIGYISTKTNIEKHILDDLIVLTEAYEGQVYQFLEMSKRRVEDFASDGFIRERLKTALHGNKSAVNELNEYLAKNKEPIDKTIHAIHLVSLDGRIVASTDTDMRGTDVSDRGFFKKSLNGHLISDNRIPYRELDTISFSFPIKDIVTGEPLGMIVNIICLEELNNVLTGKLNRELGAISWDNGKPKTLEAYLVNGDKLMLTESRFAKGGVLKQRIDTKPVNECLQFGSEMTGFYMNYKGEEVAGASMCLPSLKWTLLVEIDSDEVFEPVAVIRRSLYIVASIVALLIALIFFCPFQKGN